MKSLLTKEQIKRLGELHKEIASIYLAVDVEEVETVTETKEVTNKVVDLPKTKAKEVVENKEVKEEAKDTTDTKEKAVDLESLSYNELKKMAKDLGLSAKGTKADLLARIQEAHGIEVADEDDEEDEVEETTTPDIKEIEEDEDGEEVPNSLHDEVVADLEEYTDEELKEILASINKPTKGKRQTLIALIVQAIEDGELDFGDEDEEDEVEDQEDVEESDEESNEEVEETDEGEEEDEDEGVDIEDVLEPLDRDQAKAICRKLEIKVLKKDTAESLKEKIMAYEDFNSVVDVLMDLGFVEGVDEEEDEEEDEIEVVEPKYVGSKARIKAMKKIYKDTLEEIENDEITSKEVNKFLKKYHNDTWKGTQEESNLEYARIQAELVDDEGDQVDLGDAYYVGDEVFCCGEELKEVDGDLYCEFCGTTYEQ